MLQKATWKKIFKNEKNLQKVLSSQKELEEKLQKQIQALDRQKELRDGDKLETRKILEYFPFPLSLISHQY